MPIFFLVFLFLFGLTLGSFLNVIIARTSVQQPFAFSRFRGRSRCPKCKQKISARDNIPLLSFILLCGRCRHCHKKISLQYPLVEVFTALATTLLVVTTNPLLLDTIRPFSLSALFSTAATPQLLSAAFLAPFLIEAFFLFAITGVLVAVFVYDLKTFLIPDSFVFFGALASFLYNLYLDLALPVFPAGILNSAAAGTSQFPTILLTLASTHTARGLLGAIIAAGFFFSLVWVSKGKWLGLGDVKFGVFMGLVLGFPLVLIGLFISYLLGSLIGVGLILVKKKQMKSEIPFGPFLCLGTFIALIWGSQIIDWYLNLL